MPPSGTEVSAATPTQMAVFARAATSADVAAMAVLDAKGWPSPLQSMSEVEIAARISRFPDGQLVLTQGDRIVGSLYRGFAKSANRSVKCFGLI